MDTIELKSTLEALVFVSDVPVKAEKLAELLEQETSSVKTALDALVEEYQQLKRGIQLVFVAGGYQYRTDPECSDWVRKLNRNKPFRFSRAAMESLAIIAYRQPVTRGEVEYLRGVDSGGVIKTLLDKRLIRILGKKEVAGRPLIYGTTKEFLEIFNLHSLSDLPTLKEFSELEIDLDVAGPTTTPVEQITEEETESPG